MAATSIIFKRELASYLRSPIGYVVGALVLLVMGVLFQTALRGERLSADVLFMYFYFNTVPVGVMGVILSVRLLSEERAQNTIILLNTSPVRDVEIVMGKYLAALVFLSGILAISVYMPLLIFVNGKVSIAQIAIGYLGMSLFGAATLAIGTFASALTRHQLVAAVVSVAIVAIMAVFFFLADRLEFPLRDVAEQLDIWNIHYIKSFAKGIFELKDVVFYCAVIYFFLLLSVKTLEAKRWQ